MSYSLPKATSLKNTQKVFLFVKESTFAYSKQNEQEAIVHLRLLKKNVIIKI